MTRTSGAVQNALIRGAFTNFRLAVSGDAEIETVCEEIDRLLTARECGNGSVPKPTGKRPAEPALDINLLRKHELDALVAQGKSEAGAANLGAGFMGGTGKFGLFLWVLVGCAAIATTYHTVVSLSQDYCQRRVYPNGTCGFYFNDVRERHEHTTVSTLLPAAPLQHLHLHLQLQPLLRPGLCFGRAVHCRWVLSSTDVDMPSITTRGCFLT